MAVEPGEARGVSQCMDMCVGLFFGGMAGEASV